MRGFGAPSLKWDVFVKPLLSRARDLCRREGRKVVGARGGGCLQRKHLLDPIGLVHRGTHRDLIAHPGSNRTKPDTEKGKWTQSPIPDQDAIGN